MPQTTYQNDFTTALPGQLADANDNYDIVAFPAAEIIPAGILVELNGSNLVQACQGTGATIAKPVGVSCYLSSSPPGGYQIGDMVPCVRRGRVYMTTVGSAPAAFVASNVSHSSTTATDRGKATTNATSASAGVEVAAVPGLMFFKAPDTSLTNTAMVEVALS